MANELEDKKPVAKETNPGGIQPDPETLDTTDPQDNMEGPISSLVNGAKDAIEDNDEDKEEADRKKDADK